MKGERNEKKKKKDEKLLLAAVLVSGGIRWTPACSFHTSVGRKIFRPSFLSMLKRRGP